MRKILKKTASFGFLVASLLAFRGSASAMCDVTETMYGAIGNGIADDRVSIQAAIDHCVSMGDRDVFIPFGTYRVTRAGTSFYDILVPGGTYLRGAGSSTKLVQAAGQGASVRLLHPTGDDIVISDILLDGNKANQSVDEHRAGIFASATNLTVERVVMRNFTGDGAYLYVGSGRALFRDNVIYGNGRNGISLTRDTSGVIIMGNRIYGNAVQQIDSEPDAGATVNDVTITGNYISGEGSNDYAVTVSGPSASVRSSGWTISGNVINGGVFVVWADSVSIVGNRMGNPTTKPCVTFYNRSTDGIVADNTCSMTQTTEPGVPAFDALGTGAGQLPERISFSNNVVRVSHPDGWGVRCMGVVSCVVRGNTMRGAGVASAFGAGVYARATSFVEPVRSIVVRDNVISNFGAYGVLVTGNIVGIMRAEMRLLSVTGNVFDDDGATPVMRTAVRVDPVVVPTVTRVANDSLGGVTL